VRSRPTAHSGTVDYGQLLAAIARLEDHVTALRWHGETWIPDTEAARRLGSTTRTLGMWRMVGAPAMRYSKVGRTVMYLAEDVEAVLRARMRVSTADTGKPAVEEV